MFSTGEAPAAIMEREGLKQISDTGALEKIIDEVIAANPKQVEQYRGGKTTVINFLVGQAMKATRGQANVGGGDRTVQAETGVKYAEGRRRGSRNPASAPTPAKTFRLSELKGKRVVLYFYPKADTPGCTVEACEFRDDIGGVRRRRAPRSSAISPDKPPAQAKFKQKYDLPFTLLADEDKAAAQAYGVWKEKNMYGKKVMGIERTTFVIGADGKIEKIYSKVKAKGHAAEVLAAL